MSQKRRRPPKPPSVVVIPVVVPERRSWIKYLAGPLAVVAEAIWRHFTQQR